MSPRKSKKRSVSPPHPDIANYLPPPRDGAGDLKSVPPPLAHTRLSRLIYLLVTLTAILAAYYSVRGVQLKVGDWGRSLGWRSSFEQADSGGERWGWWGSQTERKKDGDDDAGSGKDVGGRIEELAGVLGVPVADLAAAVAGVVASAHARETAVKSGGDAGIPLAQATRLVEEGAGGGGGGSAGGEGAGFVEGVLSGMETFVGMDDIAGM